MENNKPSKDGLIKTGRGIAKLAAYSVTSVLAYIGLVALVAPLKNSMEREQETITNIAEADLTPREKEALNICKTGSARPAFVAVANAVNFTGEHGVPLSFSYGLDDNCREFVLPHAEKWQAMIGRHTMQMSHNYHASTFQGYVGQVRNELQHYFKDSPPDFSNPQHRYILLDVVNKTVNRDFEPTQTSASNEDSRLFNQSEYFATPIEALEKASSGSWRLAGDCDEHATTKFLVLRELGFPEDQMFAVGVGKNGNQPSHMVVMANLQPDHRLKPNYMTLDNMNPALLSAQASGYRTYVAFNGNYSYIFPEAIKGYTGIDLRRTAQDIVSKEQKMKTKLGWES